MRALLLALLIAAPAGAECNFGPNDLIATFGAMSGPVELGGLNGGVPDANAEFWVRLRRSGDFAPAIDCECMVDFNNEAHPFATAAEAGFESDANTMDGFEECPTQFVVRTDSLGFAYFRIPGYAGAGTENADNTPSSVIRYRLTGTSWITLTSVATVTYDLNGNGGVTVADIAVFGQDKNAYQTGTYRQRSDFNYDGQITVADLSLLGQVKNGGGSVESYEVCTGQNVRTPANRSSWGKVKAAYQ